MQQSNLGPYSTIASATTPALDTTPPTAPTGLGAAASGSSQITLNWTAATDNVGVTGYGLERCQGATCTSLCADRDPERHDLQRHWSAALNHVPVSGARHRCGG